jgi:N-acetyl sugar amidotransferase
MISNRKAFRYDFVVDIDFQDKMDLYIDKVISNNRDSQILGVTFNHRMYELNEKNYIKNLIDFYSIDHLMFSIRPSTKNFLISNKINLNKFKKLAHIALVLNSMAKYDIKNGYIFNYKINSNTSDAILLLKQIKTFIDKLRNQFFNKGFEEYKKQFTFFYSLFDLEKKLVGKKILFYNELKDINNNIDNSKILNKKSISKSENDIFWIGFDSTYKEVPWDKPYPQNKWTKLSYETKYGKALFENKIKYCNRCCMPETMEGISFDEFGICTPCRSSEEKMHINWEERYSKLNKLIEEHRSNENYDCILPISGGKDSMFQAYVLTHNHNLTPLAVTHGTNWFSKTGRYNLENCLKKFDLDHIFFIANRSIINKVAKKSLKEIGDACWHCHTGIGSFVVQTAYFWRIDLLIWGESIAERDGRGSYVNQKEASVYYFLDISGKVSAEDFADSKNNIDELKKWSYPDRELLEKSNIRFLHLGDFMFWDEERQIEFVVNEFEWKNYKVENTFKGYKSNECVMAGVHDYANFIKRGIGRATVHASDDIRRGLMTREEGIEIAKIFDTERPHALDFYLKLTGYSEKEFEEILIEARNKSSFSKKLNK